MAGNTREFTINTANASSPFDFSAHFPIRTVSIDNPTSHTYVVDATGQIILPYTLGIIAPLFGAAVRVKISQTSPLNASEAVTVNGTLVIRLYEEAQVAFGGATSAPWSGSYGGQTGESQLFSSRQIRPYDRSFTTVNVPMGLTTPGLGPNSGNNAYASPLGLGPVNMQEPSISVPYPNDNVAYPFNQGIIVLINGTNFTTTQTFYPLYQSGNQLPGMLNWRGMYITEEIQTAPGVQTLTLSVGIINTNRTLLRTLFTDAAIAATGTRVGLVHPNAPAAAPATMEWVLQLPVSRYMAVILTPSGAGTWAVVLSIHGLL